MKNVIGLDIGTRHIKLVNLCLKGKDVELLKFDIVELPKASSQYGIIDLLKLIFKNNQLKSSIPICLSISTEESFFKILTVKSRGTKKFKEAIKEELRKNVVFSLEDCVWDYSVLKYKPKEAVNEILLVAAKKEAVFEKIQLIEQAGAFIDLINPDILATYNCLKFNELSAGKLYALVDISSSKTQVLIFDDSGNLWTRNIPFGGDKFTGAIAKHSGLSFPEAQQHKEDMVFQDSTDSNPEEAAVILLKELAAELDKTFNYYYFQASESATKGVGHRIDNVLLSGGGSLYVGLDKFLNNTLKIPTKYVSPLNKILIKDKKILAKNNLLSVQAPQLASAIGLALEGLNLSGIKINLIKKTKSNIFKRIKLNYLYNFVIVFSIGLLVFLATQRYALNKEIRAVNAKLSELDKVSREYIPKLTDLKGSYDNTNSQLNDFRTVLGNRNIISRILYKTAEIMPEESWIVNFIIKLNYPDKTGELTIGGKSASYVGINKLISGLKDTGLFKVIKPVSSKIRIDEVTKEEAVEFIFKLEIR